MATFLPLKRGLMTQVACVSALILATVQKQRISVPRSSIINLNSIFLREGEGGRHIGVKTTFHHNESGKLAHIHPTLVSI